MAAEKGDGGPFVAVQSWLSPTSWLPPRFNGVDEFYDEVNAWLLGHVSTN